MQTVVSGLAVLMLFSMFPNSPSENAMKSAVVKKVTPVLFAQELEPCVKFWTERLGFHKIVEVPEGNKLGFVILEKNGVELMYQSFASAEKDSTAIRNASRDGHTFLYIEVEDLNATLDAVKGSEMVMPVRTTFYQAKEFGIKDPAGHYFVFSQPAAPAQK